MSLASIAQRGPVAPGRGGVRDRAADLRLVPAALAAWIAAAALAFLPSLALPISLGAWAGAIGLAAAAVAVSRGTVSRPGNQPGTAAPPSSRRSSAALAFLALVLVAIALPATGIAARASDRAPPGLGELRGVATVEIEATESAAVGADRFRGIATRAVSNGARGAAIEVLGHVPVLVLGVRLDRAIGLGELIELRGSIETLEPGGSLAAFVVSDGTPVRLVRDAAPLLAWGESLRSGFRALAARLPGDGAALLTGLAIGDDTAVPDRLERSMRTAALTHLTAVSGANCAIVVGAVMAVGGLLGARRRWRIPAALLALGAFVVLVTPEPSVVRASVMAAAALVGLAASRPMRGVPLLALAILGILAADPWAGIELGFVLSVLATAGLVVLSGPLARLLGLVMPHPLALALSIPTAAQLACQPAIALVDASLPLYGVPANLLAAPAAPLATIAGLLACLLAPVVEPLAIGLAWAAWVPCAWIAGIAETVASLPAARLPWPEGGIGVLLHALVGTGVGLLAFARGPARAITAFALATVALVYSGALAGRTIAAAASRPADWAVAMCDVGQGDAAVVRSGGAVAVIDTGPEPALLESCLAALGIGRVDLLVLSHFDLDHAGGASALAGRVETVLVGPADEAAARLLDPLAAAGASIHEVARGDSGALGGYRWHVLWPARGPAAPEPGNAASVVVRFDPASEACDPAAGTGCPSALFLGDLGEAEQRRMLGLGGLGAPGLEVVKVSHHGSADQLASLYARASAALGLIGVGTENDYGHPTARTLGILEAAGTAIARSDTDGLILVAKRPEGLIVWREHGTTPVAASRLAAWR